jgi:hypothetical protein
MQDYYENSVSELHIVQPPSKGIPRDLNIVFEKT